MSLKINNDTGNGSSTLKASPTPTGDVTHTLPEFTTPLAPRMVQMAAQNSTSGTYIDFTGIPSWAKRITVMFNGVSTSGSSPYIIQVGNGSIVTTGYTSIAFALTNTTGFYANTNLSASVFSSGFIVLSNLGNSVWVESGVVGATGGNTPTSSSGSISLAGTLDRIRVTTVNGTDTFDAGSIGLIYEG